jgi:hypothetical protein
MPRPQSERLQEIRHLGTVPDKEREKLPVPRQASRGGRRKMKNLLLVQPLAGDCSLWREQLKANRGARSKLKRMVKRM